MEVLKVCPEDLVTSAPPALPRSARRSPSGRRTCGRARACRASSARPWAPLSVGGSSISTLGAASGVLATIDTAINTVNSARGTLGAQQNRLESTLRSLANVRETTSAAESRIRDVDVAMETADLTRNSILQQASTAILSQANAQPQLALSLLG